MTVVPAGSPVPEFRLLRGDRSEFTRADLPPRALLVFYPNAFSEVCSTQFGLYHELREDFDTHGVSVLGVSCDHPDSQSAFRDQLGVATEMLSDWEPKGQTCRAFGVYHPAGMPERALVLIEDGRVAWSHQAENPGVLPGANLVFDALSEVR